MSTLDTTTRPRRVLRWTALIVGAAIAVVIGLLTSEAFSAIATQHAKAGINAWVVSEYDAFPGPVYEIVPSPVIDTHAEFFFGTGDGCAGYYAEGPAQ
jgi:hypothetical protein